jgi:hypothetical protein
MDVGSFIRKWSSSELTERSSAHEHFLDLCDLVGHGKPVEMDPKGEEFTFERGAHRVDGRRGWADVWKKGFFGWEYKRKREDLASAYRQLLQYREALLNPPLLVVSDIEHIVVHTNFTNTRPEVHEIRLPDLEIPEKLDVLRAVFHRPHRLKPELTRERVTAEAAAQVAEIAGRLREAGNPPRDVARFLDQLVFCLFAEDIDLLPDRVLSLALDNARGLPAACAGENLDGLFRAMVNGGLYGPYRIKPFNGGLFADPVSLTLRSRDVDALRRASRLDWSAIDPSVLGTLFERGLDPDKRTQLGAHYTGLEDVERLVEPVVMAPLRREWRDVVERVENLRATGHQKPSKRRLRDLEAGRVRFKASVAGAAAADVLGRFHRKLTLRTVFDPACGSGNFLYVVLRKLQDFEKEVLFFMRELGFQGSIPLVGPHQFQAREVNPFALELAQTSVNIGSLQWVRENGFDWPRPPILRALPGFEKRDALLDLSDPANPREAQWPKTDFIIGNPPFLGGSRIWEALGRDYQEALWKVYDGRVPRGADLCCYWFEKARAAVEEYPDTRVGLLATQAIRHGVNRRVLERIQETLGPDGGIFFAESDREWVLEGASVRVSLVGFGGCSKLIREPDRTLDGRKVEVIHPNLTAHADVTRARKLPENAGIAWIGVKKAGAFDVPEDVARRWLDLPNPHGRPNADVLRPWVNGQALVQRPEPRWIIDPGVEMAREVLALYEAPYRHLEEHVRPARQKNKRPRYRDLWWLHAEPRPGMREAVRGLRRVLATPRVSKHRVFRWIEPETLPDDGVFVFARDDDFFFGVLQSRFHEVWARAQGSQLRDAASGFRYTAGTCFETFPLPEGSYEQHEAISRAARELDALRERWLAPEVGGRTMTALYNEWPAWLREAHAVLDAAVAVAYGWEVGWGDGRVLEEVLGLNLRRR